MNIIGYNKIKCLCRITAFLIICLLGSILVSAPLIGLFINRGSNAVTFKSAPDMMVMACSAFLLVALAVENKIEKLDLWTFERSRLQMKVVFISVLLGLLWQLTIYLICQFSKAAYPHPATTELFPLLILLLQQVC